MARRHMAATIVVIYEFGLKNIVKEIVGHLNANICTTTRCSVRACSQEEIKSRHLVWSVLLVVAQTEKGLLIKSTVNLKFSLKSVVKYRVQSNALSGSVVFVCRTDTPHFLSDGSKICYR